MHTFLENRKSLHFNTAKKKKTKKQINKKKKQQKKPPPPKKKQQTKQTKKKTFKIIIRQNQKITMLSLAKNMNIKAAYNA